MVLRVLLALLPMIITYLIGTGLTAFGAYEYWYPTSPIMHAIGGFVTAWTIWSLIKLFVPKRYIKKAHVLFIQCCVIGGVVLVGIAWEWYEFILDLLYDSSHILGVGDTLIDLTMDTVGGIIYSTSIIRIDKKEQF